MNRIERVFKKGKKALIVYITAGYPTMTMTEKLVLSFEQAGADIIELGVPFSDPIADGKTIQMASQKALENRANLPAIFSLANCIRKRSDIPIVLMTYFNPVFRYGVERFVQDSTIAGVDGVIVPDLPPEESDTLIKSSRRKRFSTIFLVAPTTTDERIESICGKSSGFIYYVSLTGVTGARKRLPEHVAADIKRIKRFTRKPVCVGFGISTPAQAAFLAQHADGVIVGSAMIDAIKKNIAKRDMADKVSAFVSTLARAVHTCH